MSQHAEVALPLAGPIVLRPQTEVASARRYLRSRGARCVVSYRSVQAAANRRDNLDVAGVLSPPPCERSPLSLWRDQQLA